MDYQLLRQIKPLFFSYPEVAERLNIQLDSARVLCSRYYSKGWLVRIKRNVYVLRERWDYLKNGEFFQLANVVQVPSYISLTTALAYYGCTTQIQQDFVESVCVTRTYDKTVLGVEFNYTKVSKKYYYNFEKVNGFFIATPEKSLVDALYLMSLGRYSLDLSALETSKFDGRKLEDILINYPDKVKKLWNNYEADRAT